MKKQGLIITALALMMAFTTPALAMAHNNKGGEKDRSDRGRGHSEVRLQNNRSEAKGFFNMNRFFPRPVEKTCTALETRIDKVIARFDADTDHKVNAYVNLRTRVADFELRARTAGFDTATLQAHMEVLDSKVGEFSTDYEAYVSSLRTLRTFDCGNADGQFAAQLAVAKNLLAEAKASGMDVHSYYRTTIKADILALWAQIEADGDLQFGL